MSVEVGYREVGGTEIQKVDDQNPFPVKIIQAVTPTPVGWTPKNVAAGLLTTVVKYQAGVLHTISINVAGAAANTLTVYDGLTSAGTKLATINTTAGLVTLTYDIAFSTGLTLVSATGTGADYTVAYL